MSFFVLSDLHAYGNIIHKSIDDILNNAPKADNIILAGDIITCGSIDYMLGKMREQYQNVIYVFGNHEHYHSDMDLVNVYKKKYEKSNDIHILENDIVTIDDQRIIGSTLWFGELDKYECKFKKALNDYNYISGFSPRVHEQNEKSIAYLDENIEDDMFVVTHHAPSKKCLADKFKKSPLNCFFVNSLDKLILERKPECWIYGHLHESNDCVIGDTKVISNQYGYSDEALNFDYNFIIK